MYFIKSNLSVTGNITFTGDLTGNIPLPQISSSSGNILIVDNGLFVPEPIPYTSGTGINIVSNVVSANISQEPNNYLSNNNGLYADIPQHYIWLRDKTEVFYNNVAFSITSTPTNLISLIKSLTPSSGVLNKFFNTTSNKLNVYNESSTLFFKLSLTGTWQTGTTNLGMQLNFASTNGNNLNTTRNPAATTDIITFSVFFSVDENGNLATNGTDMIIRTFSSSFNVTSVLIIAEQMHHPDSTISVV